MKKTIEYIIKSNKSVRKNGYSTTGTGKSDRFTKLDPYLTPCDNKIQNVSKCITIKKYEN